MPLLELRGNVMHLQNALLTAALTAAISCLSTAGSAKLITITDLISIAFGGPDIAIDWDTNLDGRVDLSLWRSGTLLGILADVYTFDTWCYDPGEPYNPCPATLGNGTIVSNPPAPGFAWGGPDLAYAHEGLSPGNGTYTFGFLGGDGPLWAEIEFSDAAMTVLSWTYDDAGAPVTVGDVAIAGVPVPPMIMPALAVMALAGFRALRR
jgi:YD repeat-containing protein